MTQASEQPLGTCAHDGSLHKFTENCIRWRSKPKESHSDICVCAQCRPHLPSNAAPKQQAAQPAPAQEEKK